MLESMSVAFSYFLVTIGNITALAIIADTLLHRRHSFRFYFIYNTLKIIICNIPFIVFLDEAIHQSDWLRIFYILLTVICAILSYGMFIYTFQDSFVKIAIICAVLDMFVSFLGCTIQIILHNIIGYSKGGLGTPFTPVDLLVPLLTIWISSILVKLFAPFFRKIRNWQIKQEKIAMGVFLIYQVMGILSLQGEMDDAFSGMIYVFYFAVIWLFLSSIYFFHKKTKMENEVLRKQHAIAKLQYRAVTLQIERIKQMQQEIRSQMEEILEISDSAEKTKEIESYIFKLKKQSDFITASVYCDDWYLDFVLCHLKKTGEENKIRTNFYLQGYHTQNDSETVANCLTALWKTLLSKEITKFSLRMTTVRGNTVMKVICDSKDKLKEKKLLRTLRESGAYMEQNIIEDQLHINIVTYKSGH